MNIIERLKKTVEFFAKEGIQTEYVTEDQKGLRLSLCEPCDEFIQETRQCGICTCFMDVKTSFLYDPVETLKQGKQVLTKCPKDLW